MPGITTRAQLLAKSAPLACSRVGWPKGMSWPAGGYVLLKAHSATARAEHTQYDKAWVRDESRELKCEWANLDQVTKVSYTVRAKAEHIQSELDRIQEAPVGRRKKEEVLWGLNSE